MQPEGDSRKNRFFRRHKPEDSSSQEPVEQVGNDPLEQRGDLPEVPKIDIGGLPFLMNGKFNPAPSSSPGFINFRTSGSAHLFDAQKGLGEIKVIVSNN